MKRINSVAGFSLVELMVVIGVAALMAAIAAPSLFAWLPNARFREASRGILEDVKLAKMTAIKRNANVATVFLANGSGYTVDPGGPTPRTITMPPNVTISSTPPAVPAAPVPALAFLPTGIPANGAVIFVYNNQTNHNATLTVTVAGGISIQ